MHIGGAEYLMSFLSKPVVISLDVLQIWRVQYLLHSRNHERYKYGFVLLTECENLIVIPNSNFETAGKHLTSGYFLKL